MQPTVLLVEDESDVVDLVRYHLTRAGFGVSSAATGPEGIRMARELRPDVVVLDLMLPGLDGYEVCRQLKTFPETAKIGVLMLTAKGETKDRVRGLELGADDYVAKPFSPRELVLRVESLHRRCQQQVQADILTVDAFEIDRTNFTVKLEGRRLDLTTTEFRLISLLVERRGKILSREVLLTDVWGYQSIIDTRTVDTHIRRLREKLGPHSKRIETLRGEGYRFLPLPTD